ncbi:MAG: lysophospholipase, partial [Desulfobacterales bacterium]|nr:lysophospholipase [Desulfobacterales bacterium]
VADPHCGIDFTLGFYRDLFTGLQRITRPAAFRNTPDDLPLLCFAGDEDPVGERGAGVRRAAQCYERHGNRDVTLKLYPKGRHEMVGEIEKEDVFSHISQWILARL